jgi:hypothetical protein
MTDAQKNDRQQTVSHRSRPFTDLSRLAVTKNQVSCDVAGEAVILNLENGVYYSTNPVGARVWYLIQESRTLADVRDTLLEEFDVESSRLEADLRVFLEQLSVQGLVEITE